MKISETIDNLIKQLSYLPGVGKKSARKLALYIINSGKSIDLAHTIIEAKNKLKLCSNCYNITENNICNICSDSNRKDDTLLVVESFNDLIIFEQLGYFKGKYHVLGGLLNPLEGIGPYDLKITELKNRISKENIKEIILGLGSSVEGDTTSLFIKKQISKLHIKISVLAKGIPVGSEIEYTDEITLKQALENRKSF